MTLKQILIGYGACAVVLLALDALWLSGMAERLYRPAIGHLMAERFALAPAALFYPLFVAGLVYFAVVPGVLAGQPLVALGRGAALGLLAYATYDLTNQATLRNWPWSLTLADLAWGTVLSAVSSWAAAVAVLRWGD